MKNKSFQKFVFEIISNTTTCHLDLVLMEKELKYIKTYSANLHVQHSTLFGLLILEKWKLTKPFIDFLFFKIFFFVQKYGPNYGECHVYKAKMYVETNFSSNIYDSLTLSF